MLNPFELFRFLADAVFYQTWSVLFGAAVGIGTSTLFSWPRNYKALLGIILLAVFSPIIGVSIRLLWISSLEIMLNVFLFGFCLALILGYAIHRLKIEDDEESDHFSSASHGNSSESEGPV